jgi:hypothetical protein
MTKGSAARDIQRVSIDPRYVRTWRMLAQQRNALHATVNWRFTTETARKS